MMALGSFTSHGNANLESIYSCEEQFMCGYI